MYWPCYWICERLGITTKPREEAVEELMRFKEELTLSLLCKQTGRASRPLSPLKWRTRFSFSLYRRMKTTTKSEYYKCWSCLNSRYFASYSFCVPAVTEIKCQPSVFLQTTDTFRLHVYDPTYQVSTFVKVTPLDMFKEMSGYFPALFVWTAPESEL